MAPKPMEDILKDYAVAHPFIAMAIAVLAFVVIRRIIVIALAIVRGIVVLAFGVIRGIVVLAFVFIQGIVVLPFVVVRMVLNVLWTLLLYCLGFRQQGVQRDSYAARYQSTRYGGNVPSGSTFSQFQSSGTRHDAGGYRAVGGTGSPSWYE